MRRKQKRNRKPHLLTNTRNLTKTRAEEFTSSTIVEQSKLALSKVSNINLSPSGTLFPAQQGNCLQLVSIDPQGKMIKASGQVQIPFNPLPLPALMPMIPKVNMESLF